jgi:restriction endonuclease Mrr
LQRVSAPRPAPVAPLAAAENGQPRHTLELEKLLADEFPLTPTERAAKLKNGTRVFRNRIAWALHHFSRARLVERQGKSVYAITQRRRDVLNSHRTSIDVKVCMEFNEWHDSKKTRARKRAAVAKEATAPAELSRVALRSKRPARGRTRGSGADRPRRTAADDLPERRAAASGGDPRG